MAARFAADEPALSCLLGSRHVDIGQEVVVAGAGHRQIAVRSVAMNAEIVDISLGKTF